MERTVVGVAAVLGALLFAADPSAGVQAHGESIRVLISNALKTPLEALRPDAERVIALPLAIEFGSTAALRARIQSGERFDVTIIAVAAIADLIKEGKLA